MAGLAGVEVHLRFREEAQIVGPVELVLRLGLTDIGQRLPRMGHIVAREPQDARTPSRVSGRVTVVVLGRLLQPHRHEPCQLGQLAQVVEGEKCVRLRKIDIAPHVHALTAENLLGDVGFRARDVELARRAHRPCI